jgi:Flp pilus assembly protein TadD
VEVGPYTDAALALERLGNLPAAQAAYRAGHDRWPDDMPLAIGLGNTAYAQGDLDAAEASLRAAAKAHPASDVVLNNLAHVLMERGRFDEAEALAQRAVDLAGPKLDIARATLADIRAKRDSTSR